jgi:hypothetical protein
MLLVAQSSCFFRQEDPSEFLSRNSLVTSKNLVSSLDLDLDLDVDLDGLIRGKLSKHNIYQIALDLCMSTSKSTSRSRTIIGIDGVSRQKLTNFCREIRGLSRKNE